MRRFRWILWTIVPLAMISGIIVLIKNPRTPVFKDETGKKIAGSVASLETLRLGGREQWILIRGKNVSNPLLLFLHGGPGMPAMYLAHKFQRPLEADFVVVQWDRRAAGKSFSEDVPIESINVEQYIRDAIELTRHLLSRFDKKKCYLVGHSFGSYLGILSVRRHPELFHAFVGVGQVVDDEKGRMIQDAFILRKAKETNNNKALEDVKHLNPATREKWLFQFGGELHDETNWMPLLIDGLKAPEYSLPDVFKVTKGSNFSSKHMKYNVIDGSLLDEVISVEVPVYFFTGKYDYTTPYELIEHYYIKIHAPFKKMIWFEESAHFPFYEEPTKFAERMRMVVTETSHIN